MEIALMNYKFTAILIIMFVCLTLFAKPAYPRNDYLNNYGDRCTYGSVELTLNQYVPEQQQLQTFDGNYNNGNRSLNLRFRKDLGDLIEAYQDVARRLGIMPEETNISEVNFGKTTSIKFKKK